MNYRIAKKILCCKSRLHTQEDAVLSARNELIKHPELMKRDGFILVTRQPRHWQ